MTLYSYQIFYAVVDCGSFIRAAEELCLTPSAISHAISGMEDECGFPLFIRDKKGVSLTEPGKDVYHYIRNILTTEEMLKKRVSQINGATEGEVTLGVIDSVVSAWLKKIVEQYHAECPGITLKVTENGYRPLIDDVVNHRCDAAIVSHSSIKNLNTALQFIPLFEDPLVCVSPKAVAPEKDYIAVEELQKFPVILPHDGNESDIHAYFVEHNLHIEPVCTAISNTALINMVHCGLGHGVNTELSISGCNTEGLTIRPIIPLSARTLGIITHNPKFLTPAARALVKCIQAQARIL